MNQSDLSGHIAPAVVAGLYLYVTAISTSPDTQIDMQFVAADIATGDYLAAALDAVGILIPGATGLGRGAGPIRKISAKVSKWDSKVFNFTKKVSISKIKPNLLEEFTNPRIGPSDARLSYHRKYIAEHGTIEEPVLVKLLEDGMYEIIDGHHRWWAAKQMGLTDIPVKVVE